MDDIANAHPRLLICGDRNWSNRQLIEDAIRRVSPSIIIEGGANGADYHARELAKRLAIPFMEFPANWAKYGRAAGPHAEGCGSAEEAGKRILEFS